MKGDGDAGISVYLIHSVPLVLSAVQVLGCCLSNIFLLFLHAFAFPVLDMAPGGWLL